MQSEKPAHEVLIENARSRQRLSVEVHARDSGKSEMERLARERLYRDRSTRASIFSKKENSARENAPWAFEIIDAFSDRINNGSSGAKVHAHLEFTQFEIVRGPKKVDDYASGLLSATLHLEAEPNLSKDEMTRWAEEMRTSIVRGANGLVSRHTGVRKPYLQKGMIVDFIARIGVEHAEQNAEETWKKTYAPTEKKKDEIREFLAFVDKTITNYNNDVSKYASLQKENALSGLARE